jgi:hypothetical protein
MDHIELLEFFISANRESDASKCVDFFESPFGMELNESTIHAKSRQ